MSATWEMYGVRETDAILNIGDRWYAEQHCFGHAEVVRVRVEEVPEGKGTHWGWFALSHGEWETKPAMIQPHWGTFSMQFPNGPLASRKAGHGRIALLRVTVIDGGAA